MKQRLTRVFIFLLLVYFYNQITQNWDEINAIEWRFTALNVFLFITVSSLVYVINILSWHVLTTRLKMPISFGKNAQIWLISNLTRLLPGGIWQWPGRVYLLARHGVSKKHASMAVLLEIIFTVSTGISLVGLFLLFSDVFVDRLGSYQNIIKIVSVFPVFFIMFTSGRMLGLVDILLRKTRFERLRINHEIHLTPFNHLMLLFVFVMRFIVIGAAFYYLIGLTAISENVEISHVIAAYTIAWIIGFFAFFAPGGVGVTEVSLAALLAPSVPYSIAIVLGLAFRIVLFVNEAVFVGLALHLSKRHNITSK